MCLHKLGLCKNSVCLSSATNPKPRGVTIPIACSGRTKSLQKAVLLTLYTLYMQVPLALRTRGGRFRRKLFCPLATDVPTKVTHPGYGYELLHIHVHVYMYLTHMYMCYKGDNYVYACIITSKGL